MQSITEVVGRVQIHLADLSAQADASRAQGKRGYLPGRAALYEALTQQPSPSRNAEPRAATDSFDLIVHELLRAWTRSRGIPGTPPATMQAAIDVFSQRPELNDRSPLQFQGGAEYASGRFVHVATGRAMAERKHREPPARRYYLNPRADAMGAVVSELVHAALDSGVPLYFKFVNLTSGSPSERTLARTDRIIVYAGRGQAAFVEGRIRSIVSRHPDAFRGRTVSGFGEPFAGGVARADELTPKQIERFRGPGNEDLSVNSLRTDLVYEAMLGVTRDLICTKSTQLIGGLTVRRRFAEELTQAVREAALDMHVPEGDPALLRAIEHGLRSDALTAAGFSATAIQAVDRSVRMVALDVLPLLPRGALVNRFRNHIQRLAPDSGIDPSNLARNAPLRGITSGPRSRARPASAVVS